MKVNNMLNGKFFVQEDHSIEIDGKVVQLVKGSLVTSTTQRLIDVCAVSRIQEEAKVEAKPELLTEVSAPVEVIVEEEKAPKKKAKKSKK